MITCPRCGAENKDTATVCRMCATTLDAAAQAAPRPNQPQDFPATVLVPAPGAPQGGPAPGGKVTCPACQAANDADWAFCQQCGTRLQSAPAPAAGQPSWGAPTVVSPVHVPSPPPEQPQQATWGSPTVVTPAPNFEPPPPQNPGGPTWGAPTVVTPMPNFAPPAPSQPPAPPAPPQPSWGAPTVVTQIPPGGFPMMPDQQNIPTFVDPATLNDYPETVLTPVAPMEAIPPTIIADVQPPPQPQQPPQPPPPQQQQPQPPPAPEAPQTRPDFSGGAPATQDMAKPPAQPAGPQSTIVMSSTPIATPPKPAKLLLIMEGGEVGETFNVRPSETVIGRVDGDIKFPHDGYMSSRHARIIQRNGRFFLLDNNSRNGTFVRIHQEVELHAGDVILIGKQLFRFEAEE